MNASTRRHGAALALLVGSALALAGCSSDTPPAGDGDATPVVTPANTPDVTPEDTGTTVTIIETEFSISVADDTLAPGVYTFEIANEGGMAHDLAISGPGVDGEVTSTMSPGGTATLTVTLEAGTYELWCTIGSHRVNGMDTTITVS